MKITVLRVVLILLFLPSLIVSGESKSDSLNCKISINYLFDLSDTYGGGEMLPGEFVISRFWYGASLGYGHYISQSDFIFEVPLEEAGLILEIPFEEMAIMKMGTFSLTMMPIQGKWFSTEITFWW